ncbi:MAG: hypothetical protein AAGA60_18290 [Cyanobacteria bacterium P01_E01_bin.42]
MTPSRWLLAILALNILSTIFHYTDNFLFFDRYPAPHWMNIHHVYIAWLILTPWAILGYIWYVKKRYWPAYGSLGLYSLTSTGSFGHYFYGSPAALSGKINLSICLDGLAGLSLIAFLLWSAFLQQEGRQQVQ